MAEEKEKVSYEDNVITPDEFKDLEKKEGKKIRLKKEEEPKAELKASSQGKATDVEMLLLKTEKMEGKIEAMADIRKVLEERFSALNQEIGELRSSLMEKDRDIREIQQGFSKIKDIAEEVKPDKILGQLTRKDEEIGKNQALIESLKIQVKEMREAIKQNTDILENVKGVREISSLMQKLKTRMKKIEDDRKLTEKAASSIETMFSDLSDKLAEFQNYKDKIALNEETMHEIMKTADVLETRFDETAKKDDLKKAEGEISERLEKINISCDDKVYEVKKLVNNLLNALNRGGIKGVLEAVGKSNLERMFATKNDVEEMRARLEKLRQDTEKMVREKRREFATQALPEREPFRFQGAENPPVRESMPIPPIKTKAPTRPDTDKARPVPPPPGKGLPPIPPARGDAMSAIQDRVDAMIDNAEDAIKAGDMDAAKRMYRDSLSMYNQLNRADSYKEATVVFSRIKRLYSRLKIYG